MSYGCHNRAPFVEIVLVQYGWTYHAGSRYQVLRDIPNAMSKDCQYSKTTIDAGCDGCRWRA